MNTKRKIFQNNCQKVTVVVSFLHLSVPPKMLKELVLAWHWLMSTTRRSMSRPLVPLQWREASGLATFIANGSLYIEDLKWNSSPWGCDLLEVVHVGRVIVSEEWDGVGHHPDVAAAAVVVRLVPLPVLVAHRQYRLLCTAFLTFLYYQLHYFFFSWRPTKHSSFK